jgi:hypothetical protein
MLAIVKFGRYTTDSISVSYGYWALAKWYWQFDTEVLWEKHLEVSPFPWKSHMEGAQVYLIRVRHLSVRAVAIQFAGFLKFVTENSGQFCRSCTSYVAVGNGTERKCINSYLCQLTPWSIFVLEKLPVARVKEIHRLSWKQTFHYRVLMWQLLEPSLGRRMW